MLYRFSLGFFSFSLILFSHISFAAVANDDYQYAKSLLLDKDYALAIDAYEMYLAFSPSDQDAYFELATAYYRTGDIESAYAIVDTLVANNPLRAEYLYTLAVIEKKRGKFTRAENHFIDVITYDLDGYLAIAAQQQLNQLHDTDTQRKQNELKNAVRKSIRRNEAEGITKGGQALYTNVNLSGGYDDSIIDPTDGGSIAEGDYYTDLMANMFWRSNTATGNHWYGEGFAYASKYAQVSEYDFSMVSAGFGRSQQLFGGILRADGNYEKANLGGESYTTTDLWKLGMTWGKRSDHVFAVNYRLKNIRADDRLYNYVSGTSHRIAASYQPRFVEKTYLRFQYVFDNDIRPDSVSYDDEGALDSYANLSAFKHTLKANWAYEFKPTWEISARAQMRFSNYLNNYVYDNDSVHRQDTRATATAQLSKDLSPHWRLTGFYQYVNNNSSIAAYSYTQNLYNLGIEFNY